MGVHNPGPTRKVFQIKTGIISGPQLIIIASILDFLKTFSEIIVASKYGSLARIEK